VLLAIVVNSRGIINDVKEEQPEKALALRTFKPDGIEITDSDEQPENADWPI